MSQHNTFDITMPPAPSKPFFFTADPRITLTVETDEGPLLLAGEYLRCHNQDSYIRCTVDGEEKIAKLMARPVSREHLLWLSSQRAPHANMLWVERPFVWDKGMEFGYLTRVFTKDYVPLHFLFAQKKMTLELALRLMLTYTQAMNNTHRRGLLFPVCHGAENCYVDPDIGHLLVGHCEHIVRLGQPLQKPAYRGIYAAPELITDQTAQPTMESNRHFLATLIFRCLFGGHPLEGKKAKKPLTAVDKTLLGTAPVFVFDPKDRSNAPRADQADMVGRWNAAPDHVRELFERAFSREALLDPSQRPTETDFENMLARYIGEPRTDIPCMVQP